MKVQNFIVKEENYKDYKFYSLYVVIDNKEYLVGTLKEKDKINFINCVHKSYKKND